MTAFVLRIEEGELTPLASAKSRSPVSIIVKNHGPGTLRVAFLDEGGRDTSERQVIKMDATVIVSHHWGLSLETAHGPSVVTIEVV